MMQKTVEEGDPKKLFSIIISDLEMPITNGYEACEKITKFYKNSHKMIDYTSSKYIIKEEPVKLSI